VTVYPANAIEKAYKKHYKKSEGEVSPGCESVVAKCFDKRPQLLQAWVQVFLIMAPAPHGTREDRFGHPLINGAAQQLGLRMIIKSQHPLVPLHAQEAKHPTAGPFEVRDYIFIPDLHLWARQPGPDRSR